MAKLKLSLNPKALFLKFSKNLGLLFFLVFVVLLVFGGMEVKKSVDVVLNFNEEVEAPVKVKGVRINFDNYNQVVKKIKDADTFRPTGGITKNPFNPGAAVDTAPPPSSSNEPSIDPDTGFLQAPE